MTSESVVHASAPAMFGGSPIVTSGPVGGASRMTPFSKRPITRGACRARARANPRSGSRMPTNTISPSRISRAAATTMICRRVAPPVSSPMMASHPVAHRGGRPRLPGPQPPYPVFSDTGEVFLVVSRPEHQPVEPPEEPVPRPRLLVVLVVEAIVAVDVSLRRGRVRAGGHHGDGPDQEPRDQRAVRVAADHIVVHQLLARQDHRARCPRRLQRDAQVAPQVGVPLPIAPLHVEDRDVGAERGDCEQARTRERTGHLAQTRVTAHQIAAQRRPGGQVRHTTRRSLEANARVKLEWSSTASGRGTPSSTARRKLYAIPAPTFPTHAAITRATHPAPMSWSNRMSETGPTRVRSLRPWRTISWPAANGMQDSSPVPIAIVIPSRTCRAMASSIVTTLSTRDLRTATSSDLWPPTGRGRRRGLPSACGRCRLRERPAVPMSPIRRTSAATASERHFGKILLALSARATPGIPCGTRCALRLRGGAPLHALEDRPAGPAVVLRRERRRPEQAEDLGLPRAAERAGHHPAPAGAGGRAARFARIAVIPRSRRIRGHLVSRSGAPPRTRRARSSHTGHGSGSVSTHRSPSARTGAATPLWDSSGPVPARNRSRTGSPASRNTPASTRGRSDPPSAGPNQQRASGQAARTASPSSSRTRGPSAASCLSHPWPWIAW